MKKIYRKINSITRIVLSHCNSEKFIIVNEYPKSGGTWLGNMLSEALKLPFPRNQFPGLKSCILHGHYINPFNMKNVVIIWRDGRDVIISQYFHYLFKNELFNEELVEITKNNLKFENYNDVKRNLKDFIIYIFENNRHPKFNWNDFVNVWYEEKNSVDVHYEKLRENTCRELNNLVKKVANKELSDDIAAKIVEKYSFEKKSGRKAGEENKQSFMRKGIIGDWKNHFDKAAREAFDYYAGKSLIKLGYEKDRSWVKG